MNRYKLIILTAILLGFFGGLTTAQFVGQGTLIDAMNTTPQWTPWYGVSSVNSNTTGINGGSVSFVANLTAANPNQSEFNLTDAQSVAIEHNMNLNLSNAKNFYFWFYISNSSNLAGYHGNWNNGLALQFFNFDSNATWAGNYSYTTCPVWSAAVQDGWTPIVVAKSACIGAINWASVNAILLQVNLDSSLKKNVTMNFDDFRYNYTGGLFNKAQVIITFDGGWNTTYFNTSPIMTPNHQTGVAFLVTNQTNNLADCEIGNESVQINSTTNLPNSTKDGGTCITTAQLDALYNQGWDIASHTVDHVDVIDSSGALNTTVGYQTANSYYFIDTTLGLTRSADIFAYPDGNYNQAAINYLSNASTSNYIIARALDFGITQPNLYPNDPYGLDYRVQSISMTEPYYNATHVLKRAAVSSIEDYVQQVEQEDGLIVFTFHFIENQCQYNLSVNSSFGAGTCYDKANFTAISNYLCQQELAGNLYVTNFSQYYDVVNKGAAVNEPAISSCGVPATTTTTTTTTSTTTTSTSTTTTPQGGGGISYSSGGGTGGGISSGGGGGGGGSSQMPTIANVTGGITLVSNLTQLETFHISLCNTTLNVTDNFITPNGTGITINMEEYGLMVGSKLQITGLPTGCDVALLNVSYIPYQHTVKLGFIMPIRTIIPQISNTTYTTTVISTTILPTTTIPAPIKVTPVVEVSSTTKNSKLVEGIALIIIGVVLLIAGLYLTVKAWKMEIANKNKANKKEKNK